MTKNVPLSVRVSEEDAEFIARLQISGATTPSDKIRSMLADARRRHEGVQDFGGALKMLEDLLAPVLHRLQGAEVEQRVHSQLLSRVAHWLPELVALLLTAFSGVKRLEAEHLQELEGEVADRVFRLIEDVLRMGITRECRGYDPSVVARRMGPVLELAELARASR
jgi:hypothetical protein